MIHLVKFCVGQVREAIGVTLSVLCSNIRLHVSCSQDHSNESGKTDMGNQLMEENWVQLLTERASVVVVNIQNSSLSDVLDTSTDINIKNGYQNGDSQDDTKWMETVLTFSSLCYFC